MLPLSYMNASYDYLSKAYFHNALQLADQYRHKKILVESNLWDIFKRPFNELDEISMNNMINNIEYLIQTHKYDDAVSFKCIYYTEIYKKIF